MGQCYYTMYDVSWELISLTCALPLFKNTTHRITSTSEEIYISQMT